MAIEMDNSLGSALVMHGDDVSLLGRIDQYEIVRKLGGGGSNTVYLARDTVSGIDVVMNVLPSVIVENEEAKLLFKRWFSQTSRLHHPGIASLLVLHKIENVSSLSQKEKSVMRRGTITVVSAFTSGIPLSQFRHKFTDHSLLLSMVIKIARQLALALDYAHGHGIKHGCLRSDNIIVDGNDNNNLSVRMVDFGLDAVQARVLLSAINGRVEFAACNRSYYSPEEWQGNFDVDASDQYTLAAIIYELLVGSVPFSSAFAMGDNLIARNAVLSVPPELPSELPAYVRFALGKGLAKKPEDRFISCTEFVDALEGKFKKETTVQASTNTNVGCGVSMLRRTINIILCILVFLGFAVAGGIWYWQDINTKVLKQVVCEQKRAIECRDLELEANRKKSTMDRLAKENAERKLSEYMAVIKEIENKVKLIEEEKENISRKASDKLKIRLEESERRSAEMLNEERIKLAKEFLSKEIMLTNRLIKAHIDECSRLAAELKSVSERAQKAEAALLASHTSGLGSNADIRESSEPALRHGDTKTLMLPGGVEIEMIYVAPGGYVYGEDRKETHMKYGFWLGKYEVTQRQWMSVMGENPSYFKGDDLPVDTISWDDCQRFVGKVNAKLSCGARLPTEYEWEYACRAASKTEYSWGNALNGDKANCDGTYPVGTKEKGSYLKKTVPVDSYAPNPWGFHCMHGNVREWCYDAYDSARRVLRGGSWYHSPSKCRSATRDGSDPASRYSNFGFRICCSEDEKTAFR